MMLIWMGMVVALLGVMLFGYAVGLRKRAYAQTDYDRMGIGMLIVSAGVVLLLFGMTLEALVA